MKIKSKLNIKLIPLFSIGGFLTLLPNNVYADLANEATVSFAEGEYTHKEKGLQSSDCILIQHAGKTILVDSGADGEKLKNFLQLKGVKKIDYLILTHMHGDHAGGLRKVIDTDYVLDYKSSKAATTSNIKIKNVVVQKPISANYLQSKDRDSKGNDRFTATYEKLINSLKSKNITILNPAVSSNQKISVGSGASIVIKNSDFFEKNKAGYTPVKEGVVPTAAQDAKLMQLNSQSLVLEFKHVNDTFLLTGDLTNEAADSLISRNELGEYDVLKVPHHGCGGSSNFNLLNTTKPDFAILTSRDIVNSNIIAKFKYNDIPVYSTKNKYHLTVKSTGNNVSTSNIYKQETGSKSLTKATKSVEVTHNLNNAYLYKGGKNYYYLSNPSSSNQLVEIDFSTAKGFNKTDKSKPLYPKSGKGYICVKNNEFQYGWQKINVNGKENYYYFEEGTGLARSKGVYELKREVDNSGNVVKTTNNTKSNYYYLGDKGECLTGFHKVTINGVNKIYYFVKGANNPENKGKLYTSSNGKFLESGDTKYWIEKDGSLSTKTGFHKVTINGKESTYYLKDGVVQTGFVEDNGKTYYFVKGNVNAENKGKLYTSANGKFLHAKSGNVYFINPDGTKNVKSSIVYNGVTYKFNSSGVCLNPPAA